ncbi:MAG: EAL domain-containing protein [Cyanobacteria bacterium J06635_1]
MFSLPKPMTAADAPSKLPPLKGDILVVDDVPANLEFLSAVLAQQGYKVRSVLNGPTALKVAEAAQPDLILLDIKMPEMDGYQVCLSLKANPLTQTIPVIFLSALDQAKDKVKAFTVGGVDYIPKPFQAEELLARVNNQLNLHAAQLQIQRLNAELEQRVIQRTAQLEREIGERLRIQEELLHVATHDSLTELPNRTFLVQRLMQLFNQNQQKVSDSIVLILIECTQIETINNSLGYHAGDQFLVSLARRLETCLAPGTVLAHSGEDKFAVLLENSPNLNDAVQIAKILQRETQLPFQVEDHVIHVQLNMGLVQGAPSYKHPHHLLRDANAVMHQAKTQGAGNIQIFNAAMRHRALSFFEIQNELHLALANHELSLVYQPVVALTSEQIKGAEALVRWHHPKRGVILPGDFIPVAEETGLIIALDRYILRQACLQIKAWQVQGILASTFKLQVNLSAQQLSQPDFIEYLDSLLTETQINSQNLALEITENALMQKGDLAPTLLNALKRRQIDVSIDDFGTGYSSLSYLHRLKVENLKIDRSFINQLTKTQDSWGVVKSIINLAHDLGMTVTAEGMETAEQVDCLKALGCEFAQGYFWSRPMDSGAVAVKMSE